MVKYIMKAVSFNTALWVVAVQLFLLGTVLAEEKTLSQTFSFKLLLSGKKSQIAIWITDEKDVFVDTVYVTRKVSQKGLGNRGGLWMTSGEDPD